MELNNKQKAWLSDLSLLFVAAVWGGGFVAVKDALDTMTPMLLMAFRFTIAAGFLFVFLHKKIGKISKGDIKNGSVVGLILFIAFAFQTYGLQYTTASKQGFLTAIYVVLVPLLYWMFYKKMPALKAFVAAFMTIIGIGLISFDSGFIINIGDFLTLLCALFFALHILSIEYFSKEMNTVKLAFIQIVIAAILCILTALLTSFLGWETLRFNLSQREWTAVVYLAFFSTFACFTVQTIAQKYTSSSHASLIMSLESVFAAFFGVLLLNEVMTMRILLGSAIVFLAILLVELDFEGKKRKVENRK